MNVGTLQRIDGAVNIWPGFHQINGYVIRIGNERSWTLRSVLESAVVIVFRRLKVHNVDLPAFDALLVRVVWHWISLRLVMDGILLIFSQYLSITLVTKTNNILSGVLSSPSRALEFFPGKDKAWLFDVLRLFNVRSRLVKVLHQVFLVLGPRWRFGISRRILGARRDDLKAELFPQLSVVTVGRAVKNQRFWGMV